MTKELGQQWREAGVLLATLSPGWNYIIRRHEQGYFCNIMRAGQIPILGTDPAEAIDVVSERQVPFVTYSADGVNILVTVTDAWNKWRAEQHPVGS